MPLFRVTIARTTYAYATQDVVAPDQTTAAERVAAELPSDLSENLLLEWLVDDMTESVVFTEEIGPDDAAPEGVPPIAT